MIVMDDWTLGDISAALSFAVIVIIAIEWGLRLRDKRGDKS